MMSPDSVPPTEVQPSSENETVTLESVLSTAAHRLLDGLEPSIIDLDPPVNLEEIDKSLLSELVLFEALLETKIHDLLLQQCKLRGKKHDGDTRFDIGAVAHIIKSLVDLEITQRGVSAAYFSSELKRVTSTDEAEDTPKVGNKQRVGASPYKRNNGDILLLKSNYILSMRIIEEMNKSYPTNENDYYTLAEYYVQLLKGGVLIEAYKLDKNLESDNIVHIPHQVDIREDTATDPLALDDNHISVH